MAAVWDAFGEDDDMDLLAVAGNNKTETDAGFASAGNNNGFGNDNDAFNAFDDLNTTTGNGMST